MYTASENGVTGFQSSLRRFSYAFSRLASCRRVTAFPKRSGNAFIVKTRYPCGLGEDTRGTLPRPPHGSGVAVWAGLWRVRHSQAYAHAMCISWRLLDPAICRPWARGCAMPRDTRRVGVLYPSGVRYPLGVRYLSCFGKERSWLHPHGSRLHRYWNTLT